MDRKSIRDLLESELSKEVSQYASYPALDSDDISPSERAGLTKMEIFVKQLIHKALMGDAKATQEVLERLYGKAPQHIKQDVSVKNYTNFLANIAMMEDEVDVIDVEPTPMLPKVEDTPKPKTNGGSSGSGLLDDFGLFDEEEDE